MKLIEFSVENFKIFKERVTFSMATREGEHSFNENGENLLKTSLIYGPNASGKTTLLEAIGDFKDFIEDPLNNFDNLIFAYNPFALSDKYDKPVFFETIFVLEKKFFKYNLSILKDEILSENLYQILSDGTEKKYFVRNKQEIDLFYDFKNSEDIKLKTRKEVPFLYATSQWNVDLSIKIIKGFKNLNVITSYKSFLFRKLTIDFINSDKTKKEKILDYLKKADFSIDDLEVIKIKIPTESKEKASEDVDFVIFWHCKFNENGEKIGKKDFAFYRESLGTQKFFEILGPVIDTLENGKVLFIDEFDNSLHPLLTKAIIDLFEKNNPNNAQLIVTTHDTNLLSYKDEFIKDQFWFTEKDGYGAGKLFSLAEFKLRNDTEYSKKYLEGRFGALPFIESF